MIAKSTLRLINIKEGLMLFGCLACSSGLVLILFTEGWGSQCREHFGERMNFVFNVEFEVLMAHN